MSLATITACTASISPILELAKPIMDTEPETSVGKKMINRLSGSIEVNNVSFRYNENMPYVLDDLSLKINRGQYIAVVGASGCGKSTLLRLLLGFEEPQKGAIYYDANDIKSIDLKSLRRTIGCVIQNSKLMTGSIYENIVVSAPWLTIKDAWEAAEMAGVAEDIREMPMNMHTLVADGGGGLSGGQKQRILIARALAPKPKILFLDEATSALDNITQKHVSQTLDNLNCTRIVIAHRLSTIRQCDRVIMLEKGRIVEDGTYDDLMALNGKFAELVERQQLNNN
jgi:ABC-type bacteriocin/lantibiotic exporter with double-glycine peptidase domain